MPMDDLFKALEMFKQGVSDYQTTQAVGDARKQLSDATINAKNEDERFKQSQAIGQDLALRLTSAGASPERVQSAVGGLVPSASMESQVRATERGQELGYNKAFDVEVMKADSAEKVARIHAAALMGRNVTKEQTDAMTKFEKMPEVNPVLKGLPTLQDASDKMHDNFGQFGSTAITNLVKMGVVKASVQRVSQKELDQANESASGWAQLKKNYGIQMEGEAPKNVQQFWMNLVDQQLANSKASLKKHIDSYSKSNPSPNVDPNALKQGLLYRHNLMDTPAPPSNNAANLEEWARQNPNDPLAPAAIEKARKLRGK